MKLIKKLVDWFEDLLWGQVIKDVFETPEYYERINMKYPLPSEDKIASLYSKFQYDKVTINKTEELIGIFGTLCDYMVDTGRCDVFCPYAETKDKDDECEAWRTIQKIRQKE